MTQKSARLRPFGKPGYWLLSVSVCHQAFLPSSTTRWPPLQYRLKRTSPRPHYLMKDAAYWGRLGQKPAETYEVPAAFCWKLHNFLLVEKGNYREFTMNVKGNYNEMSHCKEKVATFYESNTSTPQLCFPYYHYPLWSKLLRGKKERVCVYKNGKITLKWVSCFSLFTLKWILITFLYT